MGAMEHMKASRLLAAVKAVAPESVDVGRIKTSAALQVRNPDLVAPKHRRSTERMSQDHTAALRTLVSAGEVLPPLLVAKIVGGPDAGGLFVMDGHHRFDAQRREGLATVQCRVLDVSMADAAAVAALANVEGRKLAMPREAIIEALWQAIGRLTRRGTVDCPVSARELAGWFPGGYKKSSVAAMLARAGRMPVRNEAWVMDPLTGWPAWVSVCKALVPEGGEMESVDDRAARQVRELAADAWQCANAFPNPEGVIRALVASLREGLPENEEADDDVEF